METYAPLAYAPYRYYSSDRLSVGGGRRMGLLVRPIAMSDVVSKWGREVAERGFAQVPNYLLLLNQFLDEEHQLTPTELLVLIQLVGSWWRKDAFPFPSMGTLAKRCGVSSRQIQRAVNRLEQLKLITRVKRRTQGLISSNAYDLAPLAAFLSHVAKAFPNEFPRNVDRATVQRLSNELGQPAQDEDAKYAEIAAALEIRSPGGTSATIDETSLEEEVQPRPKKAQRFRRTRA